MKQTLGFGRGTRTALTRRHGTVSWIMGADLRGEAAHIRMSLNGEGYDYDASVLRGRVKYKWMASDWGWRSWG
jgi:hypothetical protein